MAANPLEIQGATRLGYGVVNHLLAIQSAIFAAMR